MKEVIDMSGEILLKSGISNLQLAKELGDFIKTNFKNEELVFRPIPIITPNKAQHNWLKEQLAVNLGFIANLEHHNLNSFFKQILDELFPDRKNLPGKGRLVWDLFSALNDEKFKKDFPKIAAYCGSDEIKRLALAQKLAGLFGEYEQYKPELLKSWKEIKEDTKKYDEAWQACLYRLSKFDKNLITASEFEERLAQNPEILTNYKEIFLFGDLSFSPLQLQYLEVIKRASELNVHIFRANLKLNNENPLVQNWGKLGQKASEDLQKLGLNTEAEYELASSKTDFQKVRQELLKSEDAGELEGDESLLIYNSFTKLREVEALYNYLVKIVDVVNKAEGKLGARDIAVYVPQLDPYIPAIKTVFDTAPHKFPYTLVSKGFSREEGFWSALEQVLDFEEEHFTAPAVFNLLESAPIQKSFGFSSELDLLRKAFLDTNIRREYKGNENLETHYVSFSYGLERLIYGFCLGDETPVEIEGRKIYPVDIFEGAMAQDLFRLHHLVEKLKSFLKKKRKKKKRGVAMWHKILMQIAEDFLSPEDWQEQRFNDLIQNLVSLETSDEKISFKTFYHRIKDHLQQQDIQQISGGGGIVFSGLYPGQSMPKKVVAFLGLNFKEFPRKSQNPSFDLLSEKDRLESGDTDRGAFLQAFLNAEEKVLLSYIGQNVNDNSEIPPSSLISALQDYMEKRGQKIKEITHPLHAFNTAYFDPKIEDLFTYNGAGEEIKLEKLKKHIEIPEEINLYQLENFLKDPFRHHYNKVLEIYYENPELLPEWECFDLDNLQEWIVKDQVKDARLEGDRTELEELRINMLLKSEIPLKNVGRSKIRETEEKIASLLEKVEEIRKGRTLKYLEDSICFNLSEGQKINLNIKMEVLDEDGLFLIVSKKDKLKYELSAYIRAITLRALGKDGLLHYLCFDEDIPYYQEIRVEMTPEAALEELKFFMELYMKNYSQILPFYPELDLKVKDLMKCNEHEGQEPAEGIKELIDNRFEAWKSFFPSDYFKREYQQGFFSGNEGEARLLELQLRTIEITQKVNKSFNKKD